MRPATQTAVVAVAAAVGAALGLAAANATGWSDETGSAVMIIGGALLAVAITGFGLIAAGEARCRHLLECGMLAEATVVRVRRTGRAFHAGGGPARPIVHVELDVELPDRPPFRTHTSMPLHESEADMLEPGLRVPVRYDPSHPARVALDMAV